MIGFGWVHVISERRKARNRLKRMVVRQPPLVAPEFCPVCARRMTVSAHRYMELSPNGSRVILVCHMCQILGHMDSIITAAAERQAAGHPSRSEPARLIGSHPAPG